MSATHPEYGCVLQERNGSPDRHFAGVKVAALDEQMQKERELAAMVCSLENKDACLMCGS